MVLGSESKGLDYDPSDINCDVRLTVSKASLDTVSSVTYVQNKNINTISFVFYFVMLSCLVSYNQNVTALGLVIVRLLDFTILNYWCGLTSFDIWTEFLHGLGYPIKVTSKIWSFWATGIPIYVMIFCC